MAGEDMEGDGEDGVGANDDCSVDGRTPFSHIFSHNQYYCHLQNVELVNR